MRGKLELFALLRAMTAVERHTSATGASIRGDDGSQNRAKLNCHEKIFETVNSV
jgi:hypothetical protein